MKEAAKDMSDTMTMPTLTLTLVGLREAMACPPTMAETSEKPVTVAALRRRGTVARYKLGTGKHMVVKLDVWPGTGLPERVPCLHLLSEAGVGPSDGHESGWYACHHGEEQDHQRRVPQTHTEIQRRKHAGRYSRCSG